MFYIIIKHDIVHSSIIQSPERFVNDEFDFMIES